MDMSAPVASKEELLDKPGTMIPVQEENPFFKVASPKPIELDNVVLDRGRFWCSLGLTLGIFLPLSFGGPLYGLLPFVPPSVCLLIVMIILCKSKKNYVLKKDKKNNNLIVSETSYLCIKSTLLNLPLKGLKIECISGGSESGCCTANSKLSNLRIYCTDQTLYDLDNSNVQNKPFECIHELKNCVGEESEVEMKVLGLSLDKFKNEAKDELDEANKNGMKPPKSNFQFLIQGFKVLSPIIKISKYFYIFRDFEVSHNVGDDVEVKKENFIQIDWIYSKNFDRIFIGILKNKTTYMNKGIYDINSIDIFQFEIMNESYNFQVVLKNGNSETLCTFQFLPPNILSDFIVLINWQIRKIKNKIENNCNSENKMITTDY
jgi:hypothetical protein